MQKKLLYLVSLVAILMAPIALSAKKKKKKNSIQNIVAQYDSLEKTFTNAESLDLMLKKNTNLATKQELEFLLLVNDFLSSVPAELTFNTYRMNDDTRVDLSTSTLSFEKKKDLKVFLFPLVVQYLNSDDTELFFDILDSAGTVHATFKYSFEAFETNFSNLESASCSSEEFGECNLDYIMNNIDFSLDSEVQISKVKNINGSYTVYLPLLGKNKVKRNVTTRSSNANLTLTPGRNSNSNLNFGNKFTINYNNENNNLGFFAEKQRAFSISQDANLVLASKDLVEEPANGTLEFDGSNLYITRKGTRKTISLGDTVFVGGSGNGTTLQPVQFNGVIKNSLVFDEVVDNTAATNVNISWGAGNRQKITLDQNINLSFSQPAGAGHFTLMLIQDATGSRTVNWPASVKWSDDVVPTLTTDPNRIDIVTCFFDGTNYFCQAAYNFGV